MLVIDSCTFNYRRSGVPTIDRFSLKFEQGGVYGLLGSNGAGKSTLLQLICGLLTPESGAITLDGVNTRRRLPETLSKIFFVPEEFELPDMKLSKYAHFYGSLYPNFSLEEMHRHLAMFGIQGDPKLKALSMGQKKKVFLAFAMACNTELLILDEPTNGLDIPGKSAFRRFIAESMSDSRIFIISTHQVKDVDRILDHIIIMDSSRVLLDKTVTEIQTQMKFVDSNDPELIESALYSERSIGGASLILHNDDDSDSEINLELLFNYTLSKK